MILGFKKQFVPKVLDGTKPHTIREDGHDRWKAGRIIHFATGVRTKFYNKFKEDTCKGTQKIEFKWHTENEGLANECRGVRVFIDGRNINNEWFNNNETLVDEMLIDVLARNDGFDNRVDFFAWFSENFTGKIIHWTDLRY